MKIDNKYLIGAGIAAVIGYYFWQKSKKNISAPAAAPKKPQEEKLLQGGQEVTQEEYFAKDDIILGVIPNSGQPNVLFRKGDQIIGKITTRSGGSEMGIMALPTVMTAMTFGGNNLHFVPFGKIDIKKTVKYIITGGNVEKPKDAKTYRFTNDYTTHGGRGAKRTFTKGKEITGILRDKIVSTKSDGTAPTKGDIERAWADAIIIYHIPLSVLEEVKSKPNPFPQIYCIAPPCNY